MLVLGRKKGQSIRVDVKGTQIVVHILAVDGKYARVGIEAPKDCKILRTELTDRQQQAE